MWLCDWLGLNVTVWLIVIDWMNVTVWPIAIECDSVIDKLELNVTV